MIARWTLGFIAGTAVIWLTSPLFVRSYLPRELNRGVLTLPAGEIYRWRGEGYATSQIGRLGMVGLSPSNASQAIQSAPSNRVVALWGDSQAEGVCVHDDQKIFSLANAELSRVRPSETGRGSRGVAAASSQRRKSLENNAIEITKPRAGDSIRVGRSLPNFRGFTVLPLARSGDTAREWLQQIPFVEKELGASIHVFLVTELSDLAIVADQSLETAEVPTTTNAVVAWLPDFVIHAVRNLLTQGDGVALRRLRFAAGPVSPSESLAESRSKSLPQPTDWDAVLQLIKRTTDCPIIILYAPQLPSVIGNHIVVEDGEQGSFARLQTAVRFGQIKQTQQITVVDLRESMRQSANRGDWPHGFHNGRIGSGHLNVTGNQIAADSLSHTLENARFLQGMDR